MVTVKAHCENASKLCSEQIFSSGDEYDVDHDIKSLMTAIKLKSILWKAEFTSIIKNIVLIPQLKTLFY